MAQRWPKVTIGLVFCGPYLFNILYIYHKLLNFLAFLHLFILKYVVVLLNIFLKYTFFRII